MDTSRIWLDTGLGGASVAALFASALFMAAMVYAAQRDLRTRTIPNGLVLALFLGWALLAPAAGLAPRDMMLSIGAAAMVFFSTVALYAMGWMGGGDSKLFTVSALWLGAGQIIPFVMATVFAGGALALVIAALRYAPRHTPRTARMQNLPTLALTEVPYALAIGLGAMTVFPRTFWLGAL